MTNNFKSKSPIRRVQYPPFVGHSKSSDHKTQESPDKVSPNDYMVCVSELPYFGKNVIYIYCLKILGENIFFFSCQGTFYWSCDFLTQIPIQQIMYFDVSTQVAYQ